MSLQIDRLRDRAKVLRQGDWSDGADDAALMEQAADTIESMRDKLQESERHYRINLEVMGEMCHPEIVELMQECHATQANYEHCKYSTNRGWRDTSRYAELFGTPERAAQYFAMQCYGSDGSMCYYCPLDGCNENLRNVGSYVSIKAKIAEWLRGDAE